MAEMTNAEFINEICCMDFFKKEIERVVNKWIEGKKFNNHSIRICTEDIFVSLDDNLEISFFYDSEGQFYLVCSKGLEIHKSAKLNCRKMVDSMLNGNLSMETMIMNVLDKIGDKQ